jgi:gamma-glutamyltranspeptidase
VAAAALAFAATPQGASPQDTPPDVATRQADTAATVTLTEGARSPAYAPDGRLAVSVRGDLWVLPVAGGEALRVTEGASWDRSPSWTHDGGALVFSSDRADGNVDLWRVAVGPVGAAGAPERLTVHPEPDSDPSVGPAGAIVFVRGRFGSADLWVRAPSGDEARLTDEVGAEVEPAISPDGARLAFVRIRDGDRRLRVASLAATELKDERDAGGSLEAAWPTWSPDGNRIVFGVAPGGGFRQAAESPDTGLFVTDGAAGWVQQISPRSGAPAWVPDGGSIAVAAVDAADAGYNGDPDRLGDHAAGDSFTGTTGALWRVRVPSWPGTGEDSIALRAVLPRAVFNADAFDRVWDRVARLYFGDGIHDTTAGGAGGAPGSVEGAPDSDRQGPPGTVGDASSGPLRGEAAAQALRRWESVRAAHRPGALAATSTEQLERALHALLEERPTLRPELEGRAGVSSAHPLASAAGAEILAAGGNVVDAAIAVSFALGVVEPDASGMGGYGEMVLWLDGMDEPVAIEFMTRVPEHAGLDNAALDDLPPDGPMLALVPGPVAGMGLAFDRYGSGRVSWSQILEPAIRLADHGFVLDDGFTTTLDREREAFASWESSRKLFFDAEGEPLNAGDTLRNPDLAWTLRELANHGWQAFYTGEPAKRLVEDLRRHGHPVTMHDMARYFAKERAPVVTTYRGHTIYSGPPPVTGGAILAAKLNLLELAPAGSSITGDAAKLHAMIEAWRLQPSTSGRIADPDSWPVDITAFESKDTARARWRCFDPERASREDPCEPRPASSPQRGDSGAAVTVSPADHEAAVGVLGSAAAWWRDDPGEPARATGTTAFAVADAQGNLVAVTQTLGTWGGNFYVTPGLGFLYNDKMRSHGTDPGRYNARIPYARTGTVIAPTLVFRGTGADRRPLLAVGAAGNAWITSAVYQAVVGVIDHDMSPQEVLEMPRFLPSGGGGVSLEAGFAPETIRRLETMGHRFNRISLLGELRMGYGAAVLIGDGRVRVGGDPRRGGGVAVVR